MAITRIKTWAQEVLTHTDLNAEFDNIINGLTAANIGDYSATSTEMRTVVDPFPSNAASLATDLTGELARIRYVIAQLSGTTYWYEDPAASIGDILDDYVVSGLLGVDPGDSLTMTIPTGIAYVTGLRVVKGNDADMTNTYTASRDTYVDISNAGTITYVEVANGASVPAVTASSLRLFKVVTDGSYITSVTDLRVTTKAVNNLSMTGEASTTSATIPVSIDLGTVTSGDRIYIAGGGNFVISPAAAQTGGSLRLYKVSGDATINFLNASPELWNIVSTSSLVTQWSPTINGILKVTGSGTLVMGLTSPSFGVANCASPLYELYAFFLKKS